MISVGIVTQNDAPMACVTVTFEDGRTAEVLVYTYGTDDPSLPGDNLQVSVVTRRGHRTVVTVDDEDVYDQEREQS